MTLNSENVTVIQVSFFSVSHSLLMIRKRIFSPMTGVMRSDMTFLKPMFQLFIDPLQLQTITFTIQFSCVKFLYYTTRSVGGVLTLNSHVFEWWNIYVVEHENVKNVLYISYVKYQILHMSTRIWSINIENNNTDGTKTQEQALDYIFHWNFVSLRSDYESQSNDLEVQGLKQQDDLSPFGHFP